MNFRRVSGRHKELRGSYKGVYPMHSVRVFRHMHELYLKCHCVLHVILPKPAG